MTGVVRDRGRADDLRMPLLGAASWVGGLAWPRVPLRGWVAAAGIILVAAAIALALHRTATSRHRGGWAGSPAVRTALGALVCCVAVGWSGAWRAERVAASPVADLASRRASVDAELVVTTDPRLLSGRFSDAVFFRGRLTRVGAPGMSLRGGLPILVSGEPEDVDLRLGQRLAVSGRLGPAPDSGLTAVLRLETPARVIGTPAFWWRGADAVRRSLRASVQRVRQPDRELVPSLVVGDDAGLDPTLAEDFRTTGLTHLLAVSGTNLTLTLGFLLAAGRLLGVRGRGRYALGLAGIVGFVVLARPEPSVLRAAVMGTVALLSLGPGDARRGPRALGVSVLGLLLLDPWLAASPGFALSVLATAGIVFVGPPTSAALGRWLPGWLADALAVPWSAQLACTPVIAGLSGQVSLVAVVANLLVAPVVGPATVLGLGGAVTGLVWSDGGRFVGTLAGWTVAWLVVVARRGASVPLPAIDWDTSVVALALLALACAGVAAMAPLAWRHRGAGVASCLALVVVVLTPTSLRPGPPSDWVMVVCDVGQGDALVLRAGPGAAVVVDAGPDPRAVDRCLRRLDVRIVPLVVLTHFHADHVTGLAGVVHGRSVGTVEVTPLADPPAGVMVVEATVGSSGLPVVRSTYGGVVRIGDVSLQTLWPLPGQSVIGPGDGSTANNASIVLLARVAGVSLLLCGDLEPTGQEELARRYPDLRVDVLKVPHHGSRYQDLPFLTGLEARLALVSVGADNTYGHPATATLDALERSGAEVSRTDLDGDLVVVLRDARPALAS